MDERIFELLSEKDFDQLSNDERKMVEKFFTEEEYEAARQDIIGFRSEAEAEISAIEPNAVILNDLRSILAAEKSVFSRIINLGIPLKWVAIFVMVFVAAQIFWPRQAELKTAQIVTRTDTVTKLVYVEKQDQKPEPQKAIEQNKNPKQAVRHKKQIAKQTRNPDQYAGGQMILDLVSKGKPSQVGIDKSTQVMDSEISVVSDNLSMR